MEYIYIAATQPGPIANKKKLALACPGVCDLGGIFKGDIFKGNLTQSRTVLTASY